MKTDAALLQYIANWDNASTDLLVQLRALGFEGDADNIKIFPQAEAKLAEQDFLLKTYKECCDKQLQWIRNAMDAIHPECDVTSDPESLKGKTLRLSQTAEIERLKEINNNLIEANERLSARVADWDEVCKALWDRGYGQLDQPINETPLGSCLRLIAEGSPDPAKGQAGRLSGGYTVGVDMGVGELSISQRSILAEHEKNRTAQLEKSLIEGAVKEKKPLEATDLPLGTAIRFEADLGSESLITGRNDKFIWLGGASTGVTGAYLMNEKAEYRLPGSDEWKPCHKLVNRTPEA